MSRKPISGFVETFEHQCGIVSKYVPWLEAAGLYSQKLMPANVYMLATAIMNDPVVKQRQMSFASFHQNSCAHGTDYAALLRAMTAAERCELKERIIAHWKKR